MNTGSEQTMHYLMLVLPICVITFLFFMMGMWTAWWMWGKVSRGSVRSFTQLCSTIEEQQDLLVEQQIRVKRLVDHVRIAEETMRVHLGPNIGMLEKKLEAREQEINRLSRLLDASRS